MCAPGKENTRRLALGSNSLKQRTDAGGRLCCLVRTVAGFRLLGAGAPRGAGEEDLYNGGGKCSEVQGCRGVQGCREQMQHLTTLARVQLWLVAVAELELRDTAGMTER